MSTRPLSSLAKDFWILILATVVLAITFIARLNYYIADEDDKVIAVVANLAVIFATIAVGFEYARRRFAGRTRKAETLIERFNDPSFAFIKARGAAACHLRIRRIDKSIDPASIAFTRLDGFDGEPAAYLAAAEDLYAIFAVMNFYEEMGHAWADGSIDKAKTYEYFSGVVREANNFYGTFLEIMQPIDGEQYFPYFRRLVDSFVEFGAQIGGPAKNVLVQATSRDVMTTEAAMYPRESRPSGDQSTGLPAP